MCPTYVSKDGVWYPAKEKVGLVDHEGKDGRSKGEPYVYEGPDRAAEFELFQAGVKTFGINFRNDPDLINRAKQLGYKDVMDYAYAMGYQEEKVEKEFKEKAAVIQKHEPPKKSKAHKMDGGGKDLSGSGNDVYGGFGKPKEL